MSDGTARARRVLILEDEVLLAMNLQDMLTDLGHQVMGIATRVDKAITLAHDGDFDFAILDINVAGTLSFPVADILRGRGIPFIFASGYGVMGARGTHGCNQVLSKPYDRRDLDLAIAQALG